MTFSGLEPIASELTHLLQGILSFIFTYLIAQSVRFFSFLSLLKLSFSVSHPLLLSQNIISFTLSIYLYLTHTHSSFSLSTSAPYSLSLSLSVTTHFSNSNILSCSLIPSLSLFHFNYFLSCFSFPVEPSTLIFPQRESRNPKWINQICRGLSF